MPRRPLAAAKRSGYQPGPPPLIAGRCGLFGRTSGCDDDHDRAKLSLCAPTLGLRRRSARSGRGPCALGAVVGARLAGHSPALSPFDRRAVLAHAQHGAGGRRDGVPLRRAVRAEPRRVFALCGARNDRLRPDLQSRDRRQYGVHHLGPDHSADESAVEHLPLSGCLAEHPDLRPQHDDLRRDRLSSCSPIWAGIRFCLSSA